MPAFPGWTFRVGQGPLDFSVAQPLIGRGHTVYGSANAAKMFDGGYGYDTVSPSGWGCTSGSWAATQIGAGPTQLYVVVSNDLGSSDYATGGMEGYRIQISSDSTNGADGTWTTAITVSGNIYTTRGHLITGFTGNSWIKIIVDQCTGGVIDELDVWDATNGTPDTFLFIGDSITYGCMNRVYYGAGTGNHPSFQENVEINKPGHYPAQHAAGKIGSSTTFWASEISTVLAVYPDVKYVCISLGTNDSPYSTIPTFISNLTTIVNAIVADGRIPILARAPWSGAAGYGGGDYNTCLVRQFNDGGIDYITSTLGVRKGPDLYQLFYDNRVLYAVEADPHPNSDGQKGWTKAWADSVSL